MFPGHDVPACGFSLGLERIIVVMGERNDASRWVGSATADVMVAIWSDETVGESVRLAQELRAGGLHQDLIPKLTNREAVRVCVLARCRLWRCSEMTNARGEVAQEHGQW
jgi:histidyl-tRNA synthetase